MGLFDGYIFQNVEVFLIFMILLAGLIGAMSTSLSVASYSAFIIFFPIAIETDVWIFKSLLYLFLAISLLILGFKAVSHITGGREIQ